MGNKQALSKQCSLLSGESAGQPVLYKGSKQAQMLHSPLVAHLQTLALKVTTPMQVPEGST